MARLFYSAICSLDGFVADESGRFDWAAPDAEVHAFVNDLEREVGTYLYGRRMYEVMAGWETLHADADAPAVGRDFGELWRAADKVVFSRTLTEVGTRRTRLEHTFDPDAVRSWKAEARRDLSVGGAELAGRALDAGLVDEIRLFLVPVAVGGGTPALQPDVRVDLELLDERRFARGTVYLRYRVCG